MDEIDVGLLLPGVSRETNGILQALVHDVRKWTKAINLIASGTVAELWQRHVVDSAQIFDLAPGDAKSWADLGAGGGFPGLVIAAMAKELRPDLVVTLVESDRRKATFLRSFAQQHSLPVRVIVERIEAVPGLSADVVSARALGPLDRLCGAADRHMALSGTAIFPKGQNWQAEVATAQASWSFELEAHASLTDADARVLVLRGIQRK